jgi:hypothetical protein
MIYSGPRVFRAVFVNHMQKARLNLFYESETVLPNFVDILEVYILPPDQFVSYTPSSLFMEDNISVPSSSTKDVLQYISAVVLTASK